MADAPTPVMFAIVTTKRDSVTGGMAPIFIAEDDQERERIAMWLTRITNAIVHDLHNGTLILTVNQAT
ncbi:capping complex subunit for YIEGIA [Sulfobacillus thermosulfidooxidans]|uniref:capping complex subunit for YIEGIA n=1 Tax=Sulfobacillus thermosulfidooxidans TaxID=28034 RepID=UPI00096BCDEC|nr:hypothetical protein [Sulfobacillus thermosulfidooxidans]OLZ09758.1 hypothetical protein BFX05_12475 [Sulfobacillus thermosulfidooxidans]OLZ15935.1 hypothetical protein BFX06_02565 [Sulfobacillus thermosulfidooxidans]OLZ18217.1 hypothetical protein BFX07_07560 [Sulfobacillus thermosulfidooxidans]